MKKFLPLIALVAAPCLTKAQSIVNRGDTYSNVVDFVKLVYNNYVVCNNHDIYCSDEEAEEVYKFDAYNRISDVYIYYKSATDDENYRRTLNSTNDYNHKYTNQWCKYFMNGNIYESVYFGDVSISYGSYSSFTHLGSWHIKYNY